MAPSDSAGGRLHAFNAVVAAPGASTDAPPATAAPGAGGERAADAGRERRAAVQRDPESVQRPSSACPGMAPDQTRP